MSRYYCTTCDYNTDVKGNINKHIKSKKCKDSTIREEILQVKCDICEKEFHTEYLLNSHKKGCIEKKTVLVPSYINKEEVDKEINILKGIIKSFVSKLDKYEGENRELLKRIEKLEKLEKVKSDEYEDYDNPDEAECEHYTNDGPFIISHKQVCDHYGLEDKDIKTLMKIKVVCDGRVESDAVLSESFILAFGKKYRFDPKEKNKNECLAAELQIDNTKNCENIAKFLHKTNEKVCCEEHKDYFRKFKE